MKSSFPHSKEVLLCVSACVAAVISEALVVAASLFTGSAVDLAVAGNLSGLWEVCLLLLGLTLGSNLTFLLSVYANTALGIPCRTACGISWSRASLPRTCPGSDAARMPTI